MVFAVVYASTAVRPFTHGELVALLTRCRSRNAAADITGMLLYQDGRFLQLLEGDETPVRQLLGRIRADPRHRDVVNVWVSESPDREFGDWSMAFHDLEQQPVARPGFNDVLTRPSWLRDLRQPGVVRELLAVLRPVA